MTIELKLDPELGGTAVAAVIAELLAGRGLLDWPEPAGLDAWRRAGMQEAVDREPQLVSPRRSRGATRA